MQKRLPAIDGLRGLAILMVTGFHLWRIPGEPAVGIGPLDLTPLMPWGAVYVSLFFCLSGFGLYRPVAEGKTPSPCNFYARRLARIIPPYYLALLIWLPLWGARYGWEGWGWQLLTHATLTHNLFPSTFFGLTAPLWFVGTLAQLYLLFPLLAPAFRRWPFAMVCVTYVVSLAVRFGAGLVPVGPGPVPLSTVLIHSVPAHLSAFTCGMYAAHLTLTSIRLPRWFPFVGWCAVVLGPYVHSLAVGTHAHPVMWWGDALFAPVWGALVLSCAVQGSRLFAAWPLVALGTIAYGVYLYNMLMDFVPIWASPALLVGAGALSWLLVERKPLLEVIRSPHVARWGPVAAVVLVALGAGYVTLQQGIAAGFWRDDLPVIRKCMGTPWWAALLMPYNNGGGYRPLGKLMVWLVAHAVGGFSLLPWKLLCAGLHVANVAALWLLVRRYSGRLVALAVVAAWAFLPAHKVARTWACDTPGLLAVTCLVAALILYSKRPALGVGLAVTAILVKELFVWAGVGLLAVDLLDRRRPRWEYVAPALAFGLVWIGIVRVVSQGGWIEIAWAGPNGGGPLQNALRYWSLLFFGRDAWGQQLPARALVANWWWLPTLGVTAVAVTHRPTHPLLLMTVVCWGVCLSYYATRYTYFPTAITLWLAFAALRELGTHRAQAAHLVAKCRPRDRLARLVSPP